MAADRSESRLDPEQLHRLKQRNQDLIQRKAEAAAAKQQQEEKRLSRLHAIQEQVCLKCEIICYFFGIVGMRFRGCSSYGRALALHARGTGFDSLHLHCVALFSLSSFASNYFIFFPNSLRAFEVLQTTFVPEV